MFNNSKKLSIFAKPNIYVFKVNILMKKSLFILLFSILSTVTYSQKIIEYQSGMGTRDEQKPEIWILYDNVFATHEGMNLYADSAHYNTKLNNFTAFNKIKIELTDTTTIYGDKLFYNANTRVVEIWGNDVIFIDGATRLVTSHLLYDRNSNMANYTTGGVATNKQNTLVSKKGYYYSNANEFFVYDDVVLTDPSAVIKTDTMQYNTNTNIALFASPTHITSDSTVIYSEYGWYNTDKGLAHSSKATSVVSANQKLTCDILDYDENNKISVAKHNVVVQDSVNNMICKGDYAYSNEKKHKLFITQTPTAILVDGTDSLYMHSDTIYATTNTSNEFETIEAYHHVKFYRKDIQGSCDSVFYNVADSLLTMYYTPIMWSNENQFTADTIIMKLDSAGIKQIFFNGNAFISQKVDKNKFNQINGKTAIVYLDGKKPLYSDIIGNAQSVYYLTEKQDDGQDALLGVNVGIGSGIRIYYDKNREPNRIVTYTSPDMITYPIKDLPEEKKFLKGFKWWQNRRPMCVDDIYKHHEEEK